MSTTQSSCEEIFEKFLAQSERSIIGNSIILLLECFLSSSVTHSSFLFSISFLSFSLVCSRHCFRWGLQVFSTLGDRRAIQWKMPALIKIPPCGLASHKQCITCVTSLKDRKLLRSESLIIWSLILMECLGWWSCSGVFTHTQNSSGPEHSRFKGEPESQKNRSCQSQDRCWFPCWPQAMISPITSPTRTAINYFPASLEGWET